MNMLFRSIYIRICLSCCFILTTNDKRFGSYVLGHFSSTVAYTSSTSRGATVSRNSVAFQFCKSDFGTTKIHRQFIQNSIDRSRSEVSKLEYKKQEGQYRYRKGATFIQNHGRPQSLSVLALSKLNSENPNDENLQSTTGATNTSASQSISIEDKIQQQMDVKKKKKQLSKISYSRPSAAIERGSGFFFPGLEGSKVRIVFSTFLLLFTILNHEFYESIISSDTNISSSLSNNFSESVAIVYSLLVLFQGLIEKRVENTDSNINIDSITSSNKGNAANEIILEQTWHIPIEDASWKKSVEWVASTYIQLTPANEVLILSPTNRIYSLVRKGEVNALLSSTDEYDNSGYDDDIDIACRSAYETLEKSTSGRVSLPMDHPTVVALQKVNMDRRSTTISGIISTNTRSVLLQRVKTLSSDSTRTQFSILVASDQLLASYTRKDLQWLGQLSQFIDPTRNV